MNNLSQQIIKDFLKDYNEEDQKVLFGQVMTEQTLEDMIVQQWFISITLALKTPEASKKYRENLEREMQDFEKLLNVDKPTA